MPADKRVKYDADTRRAAAELFEKGRGYHAAATALSIPHGTVKKRCCTYAAVGLGGLLDMGATPRRHTESPKVAAASAVVDQGMAVVDAMAEFGTASRSPLQKWCKACREGGADVLKAKARGRPEGSKTPPRGATREQELERRIRKLEAENAYLRKSIALKAGKRSRTAGKPRP